MLNTHPHGASSPARRVLRWLAGAGLCALMGCTIADVDFEGRPCPCGPAYTCQAMVCVPAGDAGPVDAAGDGADIVRPDVPAGPRFCDERAGAIYCCDFEDDMCGADLEEGAQRIQDGAALSGAYVLDTSTSSIDAPVASFNFGSEAADIYMRFSFQGAGTAGSFSLVTIDGDFTEAFEDMTLFLRGTGGTSESFEFRRGYDNITMEAVTITRAVPVSAQWRCVEVHIQAGESGVTEVYVDGELLMAESGDYVFEPLGFELGPASRGSDEEDVALRFDDVLLTTERVPCP